MNFLPTTLGTRPRLAVELRAEGVVAARAENSAALLTAVAHAPLPVGAFSAGLKPGNLADPEAVVVALRRALEGIVDKAAGHGREITVVVPDAAMRVLLLEFDTLPAKMAEALPVVRFRLKKMLPFDADEAAVSYQVMSSEKTLTRVLAVAMPREVLGEYETAVHEAGFEPGAVLPSTLAALAGLEVSEGASLVVNAGSQGVTTAIVRAGILLLHRSVDISMEASEHAGEIVQAVSVAAAYFEDTLAAPPSIVLSAGTVRLEELLQEYAELAVREMVEPEMLATTTAGVPRGWLAGVRGALKS